MEAAAKAPADVVRAAEAGEVRVEAVGLVPGTGVEVAVDTEHVGMAPVEERLEATETVARAGWGAVQGVSVVGSLGSVGAGDSVPAERDMVDVARGVTREAELEVEVAEVCSEVEMEEEARGLVVQVEVAVVAEARAAEVKVAAVGAVKRVDGTEV